MTKRMRLPTMMIGAVRSPCDAFPSFITPRSMQASIDVANRRMIDITVRNAGVMTTSPARNPIPKLASATPAWLCMLLMSVMK